MSKAMKIQVLSFEDKDEVLFLIQGLKKLIDNMDNMGYSNLSIQKAEGILDELIKINTIFEAANNS